MPNLLQRGLAQPRYDFLGDATAAAPSTTPPPATPSPAPSASTAPRGRSSSTTTGATGQARRAVLVARPAPRPRPHGHRPERCPPRLGPAGNAVARPGTPSSPPSERRLQPARPRPSGPPRLPPAEVATRPGYALNRVRRGAFPNIGNRAPPRFQPLETTPAASHSRTSALRFGELASRNLRGLVRIHNYTPLNDTAIPQKSHEANARNVRVAVMPVGPNWVREE